MDKSTKFIGIDVSKLKFDVWNCEVGYSQYENNLQGFKKLVKQIPNESHYVMEVTSSYHYQLALYLHEQGHLVSVVNPLVVKRFIQMKLTHTKTDKSDARMIALYASEQPLELWQPKSDYIEQSNAILSVLSLCHKQSTALKNKFQSVETRMKKSPVLSSLKRQIKNLEKEIDLLEEELEELIKTNESSMLTNIKSIAGVGTKTALLLIATTNAFQGFDNHRQVTAYFGLAPVEKTSGSSVRGRTRISKKGNPMVRNHLFLCSFTAYKCNPQCKALYDRIVAKGKPRKSALIAVCNKLVKQAFAVAKSGIPYDPTYKSTLAVG